MPGKDSLVSLVHTSTDIGYKMKNINEDHQLNLKKNQMVRIITNDAAGLAGFGQGGKNRPFWTGLNRPVQNLSIVRNCPKVSKTLKKAVFH